MNFRKATFVFLAVLGCASPSIAADIKIFAPGALRTAMTDLLPSLERQLNHKFKAEYGNPGVLAPRVQQGEVVDVVILTSSQIEKLVTSGLLVKDSTSPVAKVGIGISVRKGAPKPDVSTVAALKSAVLSASTIGYSDPSVGGVGAHLASTFVKIGVSAELASKTRNFPPGEAMYKAYANGDVQIGFAPISEILSKGDLDYVAPLPAELQRYNEFSAAIVQSSKQPTGARELINFLKSPVAVAAFKAKGLN